MRFLIVQERIPDYRVEFFDLLQAELNRLGHQLVVVVPRQHSRTTIQRHDVGDFPLAIGVRTLKLTFRDKRLDYMCAARIVRSSDLVVVEHASRHLFTYHLLWWRKLRQSAVCSTRVLWWGHGADLQRRGLLGYLSAKIKQRLTVLADGALAYTSGSAQRFLEAGMSAENVIAVNNSVDTTWAQGLQSATKRNVCAYVGALYLDKRIDLLLEIAEQLRRSLPDFELHILGDGPLYAMVAHEAESRDWLHLHGRVTHDIKGAVLAECSLILNPGLVGLVAVDSLASGRPIVTLAGSKHSPEIEYLIHERNAIIVDGLTDYVARVRRLLSTPDELETLRLNCLLDSAQVRLEAMVDKFVEGLLLRV